MNVARGLIVTAGAAALCLTSACQAPLDPSVAKGAAAYSMIAPPDPSAKPEEYAIGPLDTLDVTVFQEPDLTQKGVKVDSGGAVLLPLVGQIEAAGKTASVLSAEIAQRLRTRYLEDPQVSVIVTEAMSRRVAIEGSVNEAGVYEINGQTTLIEALALAKGTSRTAALSQVVVFRTISGQRQAAVFNISDIRRGAAPDPEIKGNDTIVVGFSNLKSGFRDVIQTAPFLNIFRPF